MQNKPQRKNLRHKNHDYSEDWFYFVTICTKERENFFWEIKDWEMILNWIWEIIKKYWIKIPEHIPNTKLDELIIMPNHIHWIIIINNRRDVALQRPHNSTNNKNINFFDNQDVDIINSEMHQDVAVQHPYGGWNNYYSNISPKKWSLSVIIRSFKSVCTKKINQKFWSDIFNFWWQKSFHDRIIRNEKELFNIRKYISENPQKWELDKNNLKNYKEKN